MDPVTPLSNDQMPSLSVISNFSSLSTTSPQILPWLVPLPEESLTRAWQYPACQDSFQPSAIHRGTFTAPLAVPSQHQRQRHGGCWELQQRQEVMIRDSWFVTSHQRLLWQGWFISPISNGIETCTEQCENPCEGQASHKHLQGACLPWVSFYLFKSLCPMVPFIVTAHGTEPKRSLSDRVSHRNESCFNPPL